ncbi:LuxR C-terminal-related transcriptional regulator [Kitasatospora sp. NBC_00085]|uniref:LuxR C-terminal-related transcriptional regulator n=1 Tax=unclassified Kitasatospora TaxID=2633591 RepID=UPI00324ADBF3
MSMTSRSEQAASRRQSSPRSRTVLCPVDVRILEGIARGHSNLQLATQLYLSRQGIEYRVGRMLRLLRASNRASLVARAHFLGILAEGTWPPRVLPRFIEDDGGAARREPDEAAGRASL